MTHIFIHSRWDIFFVFLKNFLCNIICILISMKIKAIPLILNNKTSFENKNVFILKIAAITKLIIFSLYIFQISVFKYLIKVIIHLKTKNLNNILICIGKVIQHLRNVNIKFPIQNQHDGCQLNDKKIYAIKLQTKKPFQW